MHTQSGVYRRDIRHNEIRTTMNSIDTQALKERYSPEGSKLRANQKELLEMLVDLAAICKEHNIE